MLKKIFKTYSKLLDEKLENGTLVILIIVVLIVSISFVVGNKKNQIYTKTNILEIKQNTVNENSLININGKKYKLVLEEYK